jgi:hypothetical protein
LRPLLIAANKAILKWIGYTGKDYIIAENLFLAALDSIHIAGHFCYQTLMGILSGWLLTTVVNSLVMFALLYLCFRRNVPKIMNSYDAFKKNVKLAIFGDDHVAVPRAEVLQYFNFTTMQKFCTEMGMIYTAGLKTAEERPYWPLMTTTFLKNTIRLDRGRYVACLELKSIHNMLNWVTNSLDLKEATAINVQTAMRFLYFHGRNIYDEHRNKILRAGYSAYSYTELAGLYDPDAANGWTDVENVPIFYRPKNAMIEDENSEPDLVNSQATRNPFKVEATN